MKVVFIPLHQSSQPVESVDAKETAANSVDVNHFSVKQN
jgi:hypothetical protein